MNEHEPSLWFAKPELSDETAAQILDFLYELITGFENAYYDQLQRYASFDHSENQQPSSQQPDPNEDTF